MNQQSKPNTVRFRHPVGPKLRKLLYVVFALFAVIGVNSVYLAGITFLEWQSGEVYQNWFYMNMFIVHLLLGFLIILPVIIFGILHIRNTRNRPNRRAVRVGFALFVSAILILTSGIVLTRIEGLIVINDATVRSVSYWLHVLSPLVAVWLYVLHRLVGRRIKWKVGLTWGVVATAFAIAMAVWHAQDPRKWGQVGPESGVQYFFPALSRTSTGDFIPERVLDNNKYCLECHPVVHETWMHSAHRMASFNNPAYLFAIRETRAVLKERDGSVQGARFCAGCHDPLPFFSGAFADPRFDDLDYDLSKDPLAQAGITCTSCHAITHVGNSTSGKTVIGNGDYTITEPAQYPFTFSENPILKWLNRQLIKAKPEFHKVTYLKPLHKTPEFCGTCHKVHLPELVNKYKWLRGQNHYDSFQLSGVSGHGVQSFYYPPVAIDKCSECHMPLIAADEFGAQDFGNTGTLTIHDHLFVGANTGLAEITGAPEEIIKKHQAFLMNKLRVDIMGIRRGGTIDGKLEAPIRPTLPAVAAGETVLIDAVIRTVGLGHQFTQGTSDSNEVWMDVIVSSGNRIIGRSGGRDKETNAVDPWSHFVNSFIIDREGNRINRRNAQDIFIALYNNQIPPGATDIAHYLLRIPDDIVDPVTIDVKLQYRKFDTKYMRLVNDDPATSELDPYYNDLTVTTLAHDSVTLPLNTSTNMNAEDMNVPPEWERWNDYGIGLLRRGKLRQAEEAFVQVEQLGRPDGPINLARVHIAQGDVDVKAPKALRRARDFAANTNSELQANEWTLLWLSGQVNKQNGNLDAAIDNFKQILEGGFKQAEGRNFDFSRDYRLIVNLADTLYLNALRERGETRAVQRDATLREAEKWYKQALEYDPENAAAHYGLRRIYSELGEEKLAEYHAELHKKYKLDDNARDSAIAAARAKYPAANHAAEAVVIYDLQRENTFGIPEYEVNNTDD